MTRSPDSARRLVLATHNQGKLAEFRDLLAPLGWSVVSSGELGLPAPEETGADFAANARLKARAAMESSSLPALADDSGVCVRALGGAPGVLTARWCGPAQDPRLGMQRVHDALGESPDRRASFMCVLALVWPDGREQVFEGRVDGELVWPPRGGQGHGYDPMFVPTEGDGRTFGEMAPEEKQALSHRGRAVRALLDALKSGAV